MRREIVSMMLLVTAGCGSGGHATRQPPPTHHLTVPQPPGSPTRRAPLARPGTVCGQVATLAGAPARVIVMRGRTTCTVAVGVFRKYFDPATPAEGAAGLVVIGHWTCETRRVVTACVSPSATIHARP